MERQNDLREWSRRASTRGLRAPGSTRRLPRFQVRFVVDSTMWFAAMALGSISQGGSPGEAALIGVVGAATHATIGLGLGLYRGKWRLASFDEVAALAVSATLVTNILTLIFVGTRVAGHDYAVNALAPFMAFTGMLAARGLHRSSDQRARRPDSKSVTPVIVFGAGDGGTQTINAMLGNSGSRYVPVALIDDDPSKTNLRIRGVPVRGNRHDMREVAELTGCTTVVVAIPSAPSAVLRAVTAKATMAGLTIRVLPPTQELVDGRVALSDIRELTEADLLGRRAIDTDVDSIASYLQGKKVLVTGAGGSIGSELCRQIKEFSPERLVMLDRDESALHAVQLSLEGRALLDSPNLVVADIRDAGRIDEVFSEFEPDVVFHAAALKHLPLLEQYPVEAWKTNVEGTNHVLRAAAKVGVTRFVNVSTDKAADPASVLGYSKRIAEKLTAWYAHRTQGDWVSVRFGNVLGTRGSVIETFRAQLEAGGPLTVTHPEATRYFMTPAEACQLVIQAAAVGHRGEALVLDMGEPVRILDLAERLASSVPGGVAIDFTGLRPGEKLHECLVSGAELDIRRAHPLISHVNVPALTPAQLGLFDRSSRDCARASMASLCGDNFEPVTVSLVASQHF